MALNGDDSTRISNESLAQSETQRIYAEYKNPGEDSNDNRSKRATAEAFGKTSKSLIGDFVKATKGVQ